MGESILATASKNSATAQVRLFDPVRERPLGEPLGEYDVFGWKACISGVPPVYGAIASGEVTVWKIPKSALDALIPSSPDCPQVVHRLLRGNAKKCEKMGADHVFVVFSKRGAGHFFCYIC